MTKHSVPTETSRMSPHPLPHCSSKQSTCLLWNWPSNNSSPTLWLLNLDVTLTGQRHMVFLYLDISSSWPDNPWPQRSLGRACQKVMDTEEPALCGSPGPFWSCTFYPTWSRGSSRSSPPPCSALVVKAQKEETHVMFSAGLKWNKSHLDSSSVWRKRVWFWPIYKLTETETLLSS